MNPLWKKRLKKLATDGELYVMLPVCTGIIGGLGSLLTGFVFSGILNFPFLTVLSWTLGIVGVLLFAITILEQLYDKESPYDKEIHQEEKRKSLEEKRKIEEENRKRKAEREQHRMAFMKLIQSMGEKEEQKEIVHKALSIIEKIEYVLHQYDLKKEEEYYLTKTLPSDLKETILLFHKLSPKNQNEMMESIHALLDKKNQELEERFVSKYENEAKQELQHRIKLAESREY